MRDDPKKPEQVSPCLVLPPLLSRLQWKRTSIQTILCLHGRKQICRPVDIQSFIRKHTEGVSKVKLPGGIVGKTCYVLMSVAGALAAIVVAVRTENVAYAAIAALVIVVLPILWRLFQFAERQPQVAILEGVEYIAYHQMQLAQKDIGTLPNSPPEPESPDAEQLPPGEIEALPDSEQIPLQLPAPRRSIKNG